MRGSTRRRAVRALGNTLRTPATWAVCNRSVLYRDNNHARSMHGGLGHQSRATSGFATKVFLAEASEANTPVSHAFAHPSIWATSSHFLGLILAVSWTPDRRLPKRYWSSRLRKREIWLAISDQISRWSTQNSVRRELVARGLAWPGAWPQGALGRLDASIQ